MKKIFCLTLVVTVLLSVLIFPASASSLDVSGSSLDVSEDTSGISASSSDNNDYVTDETNEPVVIYNPQTGEGEIFVLPVEPNDSAKSSEPLISEPYTPPEKMPVGESGKQSRNNIESSYIDDSKTDETNEPVVIYNLQTGEEETFVLPVDSNDPARSSEPLISEPYTPDEKTFIRNDVIRSADQPGIVGSDNRIKVNDPSVSPFCKIVFVVSTYADGTSVRATGVILGPDLVLTCAHAIYRKQFGGWPVDVRVYTEVNGVRPSHDGYAGKSTTQMVIPAAWAESDIYVPGNDWAYVIVDAPIGKQQGWMGFGTTPTSNSNFNLSGYPDYAPGGDTPNNYFMYTQSGSIIGFDESGTTIRHTFDTQTGQSGSPLYTDGQIVYGIHVVAGPPNQAVRIDTSLYNYLVNQRNLGIERWSDE